MPIETLGIGGGLFALLTLNHFVVDWGFQTHTEAMKKSIDWRFRARHCLIYAAGFIPIILLMGLDNWEIVASLLVLFLSHFLEDTYIPVYLWARHIRRMPIVRKEGIDGFKSSFGTPLGAILFISIDQIIHLVFLLPLVYFALN